MTGKMVVNLCPEESDELNACCGLKQGHNGPCLFSRAKQFLQVGERKISNNPAVLMGEVLTQMSACAVALRNTQLEVRELKRQISGLEARLLEAPKQAVIEGPQKKSLLRLLHIV